MADKQQTLEITGLFRRDLVRHLADKLQKSEVGSQRGVEIGEVSEKSMAELADLAA
jgi:hypothetical protein